MHFNVKLTLFSINELLFSINSQLISTVIQNYNHVPCKVSKKKHVKILAYSIIN